MNYIQKKKYYSVIAVIILITNLFSCTQQNIEKEKKEWIDKRDELYNIIKPSLEKRELKETITKLDSIYFSKKHQDKWTTFYYLSVKTWVYKDLQQYKLSISYADSCINLIEKNKLESIVTTQEYASSFIQKGNAYFNLSDYQKSYENYFKAYNIIGQYKDSCNSHDVTEAIAMVLYRQKLYNQAINYFKTSLSSINNCPESETYLRSGKTQELFDDIGLCYTNLKKYDSAILFYNKALTNIKNSEYRYIADSTLSKQITITCMGVVFGNLAKVYALKNELDSAEVLYKQAIYNNTTLGTEHADAQLCQQQLAKVQWQKKLYTAMYQTLIALRKSLDTLPNNDAELGWKEMMAAYYHETKNTTEEIKYYRTFIAMRDSIADAKKGSFESSITRELKDKEQQLQISLLQKDNHLNKIYLWITVALAIMALAIIILVYVNYKRSKKNVAQLTKLNFEINEQKEQLSYAMHALEKSNKDKDRILRVVAHDLRNPISGIAAIAQTLSTNEHEINQQQQLIQLIESTSSNSLLLINELLQSNTTNEILNLQNANLNTILKQCVELLQFKAKEKKQIIELILPNEFITAHIDIEKLERVFNNLINNAIKFSSLNSVIKVELEKEQNLAVISVKDNGIGIPVEYVEHIFDAFTTLKRKGTEGEKSFGLGLSVCKQIIETHKGKIWAESKEGKGSTFYIQLPLNNNM
ncbi:MAG: tetratricopeptide repeat-containing sensor histidine kinase [Bacteroidetes bacterium]|nr:tetratricopeptide repeat-containing sensor histidine kinase [Bacteroidota bacterium]